MQQCPDLPIILYISNSGALLERMAACDPDIISLCHTVDLNEGVQRAGQKFAYQVRVSTADNWFTPSRRKVLNLSIRDSMLSICALQGNMDAGTLFGSKELITARIHETVNAAQKAGVRHIMNLGHGIQQVESCHIRGRHECAQ
jgi:uroporphyrinogen decarboxylase